MQQRVGLAQAILNDPELVILDEPTSALDPLGRREVREIVSQLKAQGKTVMLNSHLLSEIEMTCDQVAILKAGQVVRQGKIDDLLAAPSTVEMRILNQTPALLRDLQDAGADGRQSKGRPSRPPSPTRAPSPNWSRRRSETAGG